MLQYHRQRSPAREPPIQAFIAAASTPGTFIQLEFSSSAVILGINTCALRWLGKYVGFGIAVIGWRSTAFSIPSNIAVLWTQPVPLWMLARLEPG